MGKDLEDLFVSSFRTRVPAALKKLLETQHLYQSVRIDISDLQKLTTNIHKSDFAKQLKNPAPLSCGGSIRIPANHVIAAKKTELETLLYRFEMTSWKFLNPGPVKRVAIVDPEHTDACCIEPPTILVNCELCDNRDYPHNPVSLENNFDPYQAHPVQQNKAIQIFAIPYQCQNCHKEPLIFMVRRDGLKLTIVGRSRFEKPQILSYIPKQEIDFFRDSIISFQTGRTLAAVFYLRIFLEQYLRRTTQAEGKTRGEDLADKYLKTLPEDFPSRFKNIREIYAQLSDCIHSASNDDKVYEQSKSAIEQHFRALQLLQDPLS